MGHTFTSEIIRLIPLPDLDKDTQMMLRDIRNEASVRRWMYTDHIIEPSEHIAWLEHVKADNRQLVFAVLNEQYAPLGLASANAIDLQHLKADWAFYLTDGVRGGLGAAIEYAFVDFVINSLCIEKLNCEVIDGNDAVVKMHCKFLFEKEGLRRSNVIKNGARTDVHLLGLTREKWQTGREMVHNKYRSVLDRFSVSIQWTRSVKVHAS